VLNKTFNVKQGVLSYNEFDTFEVRENANVVIDKFKYSKQIPKILQIQNTNILVKNTLVKKTLEMHTQKIDITHNNTQDNSHIIACYINNDDNISSNSNVIDSISSNLFVPVTESTYVEKQLEYEINDNKSDTSITSKNDSDDSFHSSDYSTLENIDEDEDEDESIHEHTINISKNKTVNNTLNLTTSCSSNMCDDKNMYVETSDNPKLKKSMCPYCKKLQTQFSRHLETLHKTEEDVKKFCFLPKGKLCFKYIYVIYKVSAISRIMQKFN